MTRKIRCELTVFVLTMITMHSVATAAEAQKYRPPAVPLVVHNPFLSIWSEADNLTDDVTRHWTHKQASLNSIIRIDGQSYHLMGVEPRDVTSLPQVSVEVLPTRTIYEFEGSGVHVTLTFLTPALPNDIDVLSRPLTYLTWDVKSTDGKSHQVSVLFSASGELAVDNRRQKVVWSRPTIAGLTALKMGCKDQAYVQRAGDDSRIDWGYAYIAGESDQCKGAIGPEQTLMRAFVDKGELPTDDDANQPRAVEDGSPTMALTIDCGEVSSKPVERRAMIAYDDIYHVDYFGAKLPAYWRRIPGMDGDKLLTLADKDYDSLLKRCITFDDQLMADLTKVGGKNYAYMCSLAYRQSLAGCGIAADSHGQPLMFTKENSSDGNMATVDVFFPQAPILVFLSPTLVKATLAPVFEYSDSPRWKWPNAPHDLGEYPIAFGRDEGGEGMPVEETGNMIIMADALCQEEGNTRFVDQWWPLLTKWAAYLEKYGPDPEEQLCTDDFKGRLAHNANLSVKAIVALAAYGDMARMHGDPEAAKRYMAMARSDARHWVDVDGEADHFKLAFDKPKTWGQNYNMIWDRILNLNVFPDEVYKKQIEFYKKHLKPYGLPLDSRNTLTKTDWTTWVASLADNQTDFETLTNPIVDYLNTTTTRTPFVDSYWTDNEKRDQGVMRARPVIGGIFVRMLTDKGMWKKWASMDKEVTGNWAPLPKPPIVTEVIPTSRKTPQTWAYTISKPGDSWIKPDFDDSQWTKAPAGFGRGSPDSNPHTDWKTDDIWIRRDFDMPDVDRSKLKFVAYHDEDMEIYINGVLAGSASGFNTSYQVFDITADGLAAFKTGKNMMAVHCHQTTGGQFIDVGICTITPDDGEHASAQ
jgi:hypothetical protein